MMELHNGKNPKGHNAMTTDNITFRTVEERVAEIVQDLFDEHGRDRDACYDSAHECIDGLDWVIYHHKAGKVIDALQAFSDGAAIVDEAWDSLGDMGYTLGSGDGQISSLGDLQSSWPLSRWRP